MKRTLFIAAAVVALGAVVALSLWLVLQPKPATEITLYGNVDLREVELPFNDSERVEAVLVSEGDRVVRGQVLARLDTGRLAAQAGQAAAQVAAQQQAVDKLHAGARPEEIAQARASPTTNSEARRTARLGRGESRQTEVAFMGQLSPRSPCGGDLISGHAYSRPSVAPRTRVVLSDLDPT